MYFDRNRVYFSFRHHPFLVRLTFKSLLFIFSYEAHVTERSLDTAFSAESLNCNFKACLLNTGHTEMELQCVTPKYDKI